jgi:RecA/RadA recombinase
MADSDRDIFSASDTKTSAHSASKSFGLQQSSIGGVYIAANLIKASAAISLQFAASAAVSVSGVMAGETIIGGVNSNFLGLRAQCTGKEMVLHNFKTRNYLSLNEAAISDQQVFADTIQNMAAATAAVVTSAQNDVKRTLATGAANSLHAVKSALSSHKQCASAQKTEVAAIKKEVKEAMRALNGAQTLTAATVNQVIQLRKRLDAVSNSLATQSNETAAAASDMTSSLMQLYQLKQIQ